MVAAEALLPSSVTLSASAPGPLRLLKTISCPRASASRATASATSPAPIVPILIGRSFRFLKEPNPPPRRSPLGGAAGIVSFENTPVKVIPIRYTHRYRSPAWAIRGGDTARQHHVEAQTQYSVCWLTVLKSHL